MTTETIHLIGFGSQGKAWANCLKTSGWNVEVYLPEKSSSHLEAKKQGFQSQPLFRITKNLANSQNATWVAMTCPDQEIGAVYDELIKDADVPVNIVLAHGFAIYSRDLVLKNNKHRTFLLAPKAIGPQLLENFKTNFPKPHALVAAISVSPTDPEFNLLYSVAKGLGFSAENLVTTTFEQETLGDLISEQGLLCGGIFNLLLWTYQSMVKAGVPPRLIQEECISELELIAGLIKSRGPSSAFQSISQVAQAGTVRMNERFHKADFLKQFLAQAEDIQNGEFIQYFKTKKWQTKASELIKDLSDMEESFSFAGKKRNLS